MNKVAKIVFFLLVSIFFLQNFYFLRVKSHGRNAAKTKDDFESDRSDGNEELNLLQKERESIQKEYERRNNEGDFLENEEGSDQQSNTTNDQIGKEEEPSQNGREINDEEQSNAELKNKKSTIEVGGNDQPNQIDQKSIANNFDNFNNLDFEFDFELSQLPKTKNVIFQVIITDQKDHWSFRKNLKDDKLNEFVGPMCDSAKRWNEGLITLHTSTKEIKRCSGWENSLQVKFKSKLTKMITFHDERLFVVEKFIKKYELQKRYDKMMLTDSDVYILRNDPWHYFDKECKGFDLWTVIRYDSAELLKYDPFDAIFLQISECYGEDFLQKLFRDNMKNINYPIAGKSGKFLELLEKANTERLNAVKVLGIEQSSQKVCDMASVFKVLYDFNMTDSICKHGLRLADFDVVFSHKTEVSGYRPEFTNQITKLAKGKIPTRMTVWNYNYATIYNSLLYFSMNAARMLFEQEKIPNFDVEPKKLLNIAKNEFPDHHLFNTTFSLYSEHEPIRYIHHEINISDSSELPNTKNVIIQILMFDEYVYNGEDSDINLINNSPLCSTAKKYNKGLITLHNIENYNFKRCNSWGNGVSVYYKSKLGFHLSPQDEKMVLLEQFIRQF